MGRLRFLQARLHGSDPAGAGRRRTPIGGIGAALMVAGLAAAACTPSGEPPVRQAGEACAVEGPLGEIACGREALLAPAARIEGALDAAETRLSPEGRKLLRDTLEAWAQAQRVACGAQGPGEISPEAAVCLQAALEARAESAAGAVSEQGGFLIQRVEANDAIIVTPEIAAASGLGDGAPKAMVQSVGYPRIDNPARNPAIERFNQAMAQRPIGRVGAPTEQTVDYTVAFASSDLISVRFDTYDYTLGAAHPNSGMRAVTILMRSGAPIAPGDVFAPGSGWEDFLTQRAMKSLSTRFEEFGAGPPEESDVRDTATKAHNWVIGASGLTLLFPPYAIGPYALGGQEVEIAWKDLKPFLNAGAPAPIGQS